MVGPAVSYGHRGVASAAGSPGGGNHHRCCWGRPLPTCPAVAASRPSCPRYLPSGLLSFHLSLKLDFPPYFCSTASPAPSLAPLPQSSSSLPPLLDTGVFRLCLGQGLHSQACWFSVLASCSSAGLPPAGAPASPGPLPHRCSSGRARWQGWKSSGMNRPAGT